MKKRTLIALLLALLMSLSLCACGSSSGSAKNASSSADYYADEAPSAMYRTEEAAYGGGFAAAETAAAEAESGTGDGADAPEDNPEKIIYSGEATVETTDFEQSIVDLNALIEINGGFVESSSVNGSNYYDNARGYVSRRTASYTLRIPSSKFSELMTRLSDIGNVPYTYTYTENVTAQYYDVQARLTAYKAQETRLLEMMELAETVEDIITIEDKLTDVRYRIDSLESSLRNWDRRVAYSTLNVTVKEVQVYTPETVTKLSYGEELARALRDSLRNTGTFFKNLLVFLVSILPALVILAVLFFVCRPLVKKLAAKGRARRAKRAEEKAAKKALKLQTRTDADRDGGKKE